MHNRKGPGLAAGLQGTFLNRSEPPRIRGGSLRFVVGRTMKAFSEVPLDKAFGAPSSKHVGGEALSLCAPAGKPGGVLVAPPSAVSGASVTPSVSSPPR